MTSDTPAARLTASSSVVSAIEPVMSIS